jgi:hypothetical protein
MANTDTASSYAEDLLMFVFDLVDGLLSTPQSQRFDWKAKADKAMEKKRLDLETAKPRLYPRLPKDPLPLSLPTAAYAGTYRHPAYQTLEVVNNASIYCCMRMHRTARGSTPLTLSTSAERTCCMFDSAAKAEFRIDAAWHRNRRKGGDGKMWHQKT